MRFQVYINESINDKALMKAVFFTGYPGSGKTTIGELITDGSLPIMSISSDVWKQFFNKYKGRGEWSDVGGKVKKITISNVVNNTNGLLPVFVDTTGANIKNFKNRVDILVDLGYDVSLVIVDVKPETSAARVARRNDDKEYARKVDIDFVLRSHESIAKAIPQFKNIIPDNMTISNDGPIDDDVILKAYRAANKFFNSPIKNPKGKKLVDYMKKNGHKYYNEVPEEWRNENGYPDLDTNSMKWFNKL